MNERRYASGEVPRVGDVVEWVPQDYRHGSEYGRKSKVIGFDEEGDPMTEYDVIRGSRVGSLHCNYRLLSRPMPPIDGEGVFHVAAPKDNKPPDPDFVCPQRAELRRQMIEAWTQCDYATIVRVAKLLELYGLKSNDENRSDHACIS